MTNARTAKSTREKAAELRAEAQRAEARRRTTWLVGSLLAALLIVVAGFALIRTAADDQQARQAASAAPPANLYQGGILDGSTSAPVTVEVYEDFLCPACKSFEQQNAAQLSEWVKAGTVKVIYHPVAILDRLSEDEYSTRSASAAAAVVNAKPGAFKAYHDALFANQPAENGPGLPDAQLIELAVTAGVDKAAVEAAINDRQYATWVTGATEDFSKKGYTGTPTVVVNGEQLKEWTAQNLAAAVAKAGGAASK